MDCMYSSWGHKESDITLESESDFHFHFVSITQALKMKTSGMVSTIGLTRPM